MSASILDPRMIDQLKPLAVTNTNFINITSAFISVPGANSNNWTDTFNIVKDLSGDWSSTFNLVQALSSDWEESVTIAEVSSTAEFLLTTLDDFATFLQTNSASWEESADILPTVTNYLSTSNVIVSGLEVLNGVSFIGDVTIYGTLTALSGFVLVPSFTTTTSALSISNIQPSPALEVFQGIASPTIALFKNDTGEIVNINSTGITTVGILSTNATGDSNLWNLGYITSLSSDLWNQAYTNIQNTSANWDNAYQASLSSNLWNDVQTTVQLFSSSWEESTDITELTTLLQTNSANWDNAYQASLSSNLWNDVQTGVQTNSANWDSAYQASLSSNLWNDVYTSVQTNSANWEESADIIPTVTNYLSTNNIVINTLYVTSLTALSSQFDQTIYTTTTSESITATNLNVTNQLLSAGVDLFNIFLTTESDAQTLSFDELTSDLTILSGNTISLSSLSDKTIINSVSSLLAPVTLYQDVTANWQTTYETVCALSASWEESTDILPTVTNYLSTNNVLANGITITGDVSATGTIYSANTLTTSICAMSGDGITPFTMQFTNGLLTTITF